MAKEKYHGGSWKVAYADFVTAMMALFLVLWLTAQDTKVKEAIERAFRNPYSSLTKESVGIISTDKEMQPLTQSKGSYDSASALNLELLRRLTEDLSKLLAKDNEGQESARYELTSEGLLINVFDSSHKPLFESESARFTPYGAWVFSTLAWEVSRYPTFTLQLSGHTEAGHPGITEDYGPWELSADRANAARRKLLQHGVAPAQIFQVAGYGDTHPMPNTAPADEINRRVSVLLRIQQADHPHEATPTNQVAATRASL